MDATPISPPVPDSAITAPRVAVIPAAGFGTRLRPLTNSLPKEMLPVGRLLALEWIVAEMHAAGVTRIVFVLSPVKEPLVRGRFGDTDPATGMEFAYALQPEMRGLGDAILRAEPFIEPRQPFVVALGDAVFEEPTIGGLTRRLAAAAQEAGAAVGLAVQPVPPERISRYGIVKPMSLSSERAGTSIPISDIVEKPALEEAPSNLAATARYVVSPEVFDVLRNTPPGKGGEIQLTDAFRTLLAAGKGGVAVPLEPGEARHDLGGLDSYFKAFVAFALADPEHGAGLRDYLVGRLQQSELTTRKEAAE